MCTNLAIEGGPHIAYTHAYILMLRTEDVLHWFHLVWIFIYYDPLVNKNIVIEKMAIEIVDLPIDSMVDLSIAKC